MMNELEAFSGGDLVTAVFLYVSAALLIGSMILVMWLERGKARVALTPVGAPGAVGAGVTGADGADSWLPAVLVAVTVKV